MQVDYKVIIFFFEILRNLRHIFINRIELMYIWIVFEYSRKLFFGKEMHLSILNLLFHASEDRRSQDNIPNGRKTYEQYFRHAFELKSIKKRNPQVLYPEGFENN